MPNMRSPHVLIMTSIMVVMVAFAVAGFENKKQFDRMIESRKWVVHALEVKLILERLKSAIDHNDIYVANRLTNELRTMVVDPMQAKRGAELEATLPAPSTRTETILNDLRNAEDQLFKRRMADLQANAARSASFVSAINIFALLFQIILLGVVWYSFGQSNAANSRLKALLSSMAEGVYQIDSYGICKFINAAAETMLGYSSAEICGNNMHDLVHHTAPDGSHRSAEHCLLMSVIQTKQPYRTSDDIFITKQGLRLPVEVAAEPLVQNGHLTGAVVCFRDITERKEVERRLSEFYSTVSHELRTPLTSIRGAFGLLEGGKGGDLSPKAMKLVSMGREESERLVRLINDILDIRKIEAGKFELNLSSTSADQLVLKTVESLKTLAEQAEIHLSVQIDAAPALTVDTDRITQVLTNLVSNALKFSPRMSEVVVGTAWAPGGVRFLLPIMALE